MGLLSSRVPEINYLNLNNYNEPPMHHAAVGPTTYVS